MLSTPCWVLVFGVVVELIMIEPILFSDQEEFAEVDDFTSVNTYTDTNTNTTVELRYLELSGGNKNCSVEITGVRDNEGKVECHKFWTNEVC